MKRNKLSNVVRMMLIILCRYPKVLLFSVSEAVIGAAQVYIPLLLLAPFLQSIIEKNVHLALLYGLFYALTTMVLEVGKRILQKHRMIEGSRVSETAINDVYIKIAKLKYSDFSRSNVKTMFNRALEELYYEFDYSDIVDSAVVVLENSIKIICSCTLTIYLLFSVPQKSATYWWLGHPCISVFAFLLITSILTYFSIRNTRKDTKQLNDLIKDHAKVENRLMYLQNEVVFRFPYYITYHLYRMHSLLYSKFRENQQANISYFSRSRRVRMHTQNTYDISSCIFTFCSFFITSVKVLTGAIPLSMLLTYSQSMNKLHDASMALIASYGKLDQALPYFKNIDEFMDYSEEHSTTPTLASLEPPYNIRFHHVFYKYPNAEKYAIEDLCLEFSNTNTYAIVGENGSGKTTLLMLLCRLVEPCEGQITINGVNIQQYDLHDYRKLISTVMQDSGIYPLPLYENIALSPIPNTVIIANLLKTTGIHNLEKRNSSNEENIKYSSGECQKILAARAFYKNSPIYIFDEPTSTMDPLSEEEFYATLLQNSSAHMVLFVSHRLSSCKLCDRIIVMHNGRVIESGTHKELIQQHGEYYCLWSAQASTYQ